MCCLVMVPQIGNRKTIQNISTNDPQYDILLNMLIGNSLKMTDFLLLTFAGKIYYYHFDAWFTIDMLP